MLVFQGSFNIQFVGKIGLPQQVTIVIRLERDGKLLPISFGWRVMLLPHGRLDIGQDFTHRLIFPEHQNGTWLLLYLGFVIHRLHTLDAHLLLYCTLRHQLLTHLALLVFLPLLLLHCHSYVEPFRPILQQHYSFHTQKLRLIYYLQILHYGLEPILMRGGFPKRLVQVSPIRRPIIGSLQGQLFLPHRRRLLGRLSQDFRVLLDSSLLDSIILPLPKLDLLGSERDPTLLGVLVEEEGDVVLDMLVDGRLVDIGHMMRDDCLGGGHLVLEELLLVLEGERLLALLDEGKHADQLVLYRLVLGEVTAFHQQ
jgi:hypothetical protein